MLYLVGCAAPPVLELTTAVRAAQRLGMDTCAVLTPSARTWVDVPSVAAATGHPVRSAYKLPGEPDVAPKAEAVLVAPASFNTVNKAASGATDTLALGVVAEAIGKALPIVLVPFVNEPLARHPVFRRSLRELRAFGVDVLFDERLVSPARRESGFAMVGGFPWEEALQRLRAAPAAPG